MWKVNIQRKTDNGLQGIIKAPLNFQLMWAKNEQLLFPCLLKLKAFLPNHLPIKWVVFFFIYKWCIWFIGTLHVILEAYVDLYTPILPYKYILYRDRPKYTNRNSYYLILCLETNIIHQHEQQIVFFLFLILI